MTTKQLNEAKLSTLVEYYNELSESIGGKTIKSFKDRETAIKRIDAVHIEIKEKAAAEKKAAKAAEKKAAAKKSDDPLAKETAKRGAVAKFDYEPAERQTAPRPGTLRGRAFELLQVGTTPEELEDLVVAFWKEKGLKPEDQKIGKRLRALELVRLLRYQNGYGFKQDKEGNVVVIGDLAGSAPAKVDKKTKELPKKAKAEADDIL